MSEAPLYWTQSRPVFHTEARPSCIPYSGQKKKRKKKKKKKERGAASAQIAEWVHETLRNARLFHARKRSHTLDRAKMQKVFTFIHKPVRTSTPSHPHPHLSLFRRDPTGTYKVPRPSETTHPPRTPLRILGIGLR